MYKVFLVDDDAIILDELIGLADWKGHGYEIAGSSTDPYEAYDMIVNLKPSVVFVDLKMPGMDGIELMKKLQDAGVHSEFICVSAYDAFENVRDFFKSSGFDYILKPVSAGDIEALLVRLTGRLSASGCTPYDDKMTENAEFNKVILYLNEHYKDRITLSGIASSFGFSENYICKLFQKHLNTTLGQYITDIRMEKAKDMLLNKDVLIKEVAIETGYPDYARFSKVFKNYYGISPNEMREKGI